MIKISVPLCYLPDSAVRVFEYPGCALTRTQTNHLVEISRRPDFAYFHIMVRTYSDLPNKPNKTGSTKSGKILSTWFAKDGTKHDTYIGRNRVLEDIVEKLAPVPVDSSVYAALVHQSATA